MLSKFPGPLQFFCENHLPIFRPFSSIRNKLNGCNVAFLQFTRFVGFTPNSPFFGDSWTFGSFSPRVLMKIDSKYFAFFRALTEKMGEIEREDRTSEWRSSENFDSREKKESCVQNHRGNLSKRHVRPIRSAPDWEWGPKIGVAILGKLGCSTRVQTANLGTCQTPRSADSIRARLRGKTGVWGQKIWVVGNNGSKTQIWKITHTPRY